MLTEFYKGYLVGFRLNLFIFCQPDFIARVTGFFFCAKQNYFCCLLRWSVEVHSATNVWEKMGRGSNNISKILPLKHKCEGVSGKMHQNHK